MNYVKLYDDLIASRKIRNETLEYTEIHHIIPKCLGGTDGADNLVVLTFREHYLAHWLLTKIYFSNERIFWAFSLMDGRLSPLSSRVLTSKQFERCKQAAREAARIRWTNDNPMHKKDVKEKISNSMKGDNNPLRKYPHKNRTAYPVKVTFTDGSEQTFECGKYAQDALNVPKATWKHWVRYGIKSKKYDIVKIEKLACEG